MTSEFIAALQFLTRIRLCRGPEFEERLFGRSVRFFPLVGLITGGLLAVAAALTAGWLPGTVRSTLLVTLCVFLTGALHCDGLMDTADGLLSGRSPDRMLEIMKDSRVGAFGVIAAFFLLLWKWSLVHDMPDSLLGPALICMMTASRFAMVLSIVSFPYARPDGMGKAFARHAGRGSLGMAGLALIALLILLWAVYGEFACAAAVAALIAVTAFALGFGRWASGKVGGLTGDVYGATTELSEVVVLVVFLMSAYVRWVR